MRRVDSIDWPFPVSRGDSRRLTDQVADGLRRAAGSGAFRETGTLPSYETIAATLGVSRNVARAAVRRLSDQGIVKSRPRIGAQILDRRERTWRGRVLLIIPDNDHGYYKNMFIGAVRDRLLSEGYLVLSVCVGETKVGRHDFGLLDHMLETTFDLALLMYGRNGIERHLSAAGVPYVVCSGRERRLPHCVGWVRQAEDHAIPDFVRACLAADVKQVTRVWCWKGIMELEKAFSGTDIRVVDLEVPMEGSRCQTLEGVQTAALERFMKFCADSEPFPDVFLFTDDYLTLGALQAFGIAGVRIPEDVGLVTLSNAGLGPVYVKPLTRLEMDASRHGRMVADAILIFLQKGRFPENLALGTVYLHGETFPGRFR